MPRMSAGDDVVNGRDHRLARIDTELGEDRQERRPERFERLLGLPHVEDLDQVVRLESDVMSPPGRCSDPGGFWLADGVVVLLRREVALPEVKPECHCCAFHFLENLRASLSRTGGRNLTVEGRAAGRVTASHDWRRRLATRSGPRPVRGRGPLLVAEPSAGLEATSFQCRRDQLVAPGSSSWWSRLACSAIARASAHGRFVAVWTVPSS